MDDIYLSVCLCVVGLVCLWASSVYLSVCLCVFVCLCGGLCHSICQSNLSVCLCVCVVGFVSLSVSLLLCVVGFVSLSVSLLVCVVGFVSVCLCVFVWWALSVYLSGQSIFQSTCVCLCAGLVYISVCVWWGFVSLSCGLWGVPLSEFLCTMFRPLVCKR